MNKNKSDKRRIINSDDGMTTYVIDENGTLLAEYANEDRFYPGIDGENKTYNEDGTLKDHYLIIDGKVSDIDPSTLTRKDKMVLKLKHNINFLDEQQ